MGAVAFNYDTWAARYPEFLGVSKALAQAYFDEANLYVANEAWNPAFAQGSLGALLNMATAHIAWLNAPRDAKGNPSSTGAAPPNIVGRITSANEGSVSVSAENNYPPGSAQWWQQTRYGAAFWQASNPYRRFRYAANPTFVMPGIFPYRGMFR